MAVTTRESFMCFMLWATKRSRFPEVCMRNILSWTVGPNAYITSMMENIKLVSDLKDRKEDANDKFAFLLDGWRMFYDETRQALRKSERLSDYVYIGGIAPLSGVYDFTDDGSDTAYIKFFYMRLLGFGDPYEAWVGEALLIDGWPTAAIQTVCAVVQQGSMWTQESFDATFQDPELLPYAAFVAGYLNKWKLFFRWVRSVWAYGYCLHSFALLGILSSMEHRSDVVIPDEFLPHVIPLVKYLGLTSKYKLIVLAERLLVRSIPGSNPWIFIHLIVTMVHCEGYNFSLSPPMLRDEDFLLVVLKRLIRKETSYRLLMKYECMVNLNVRSREFKTEFAELVQNRVYS